MRYQIHEPFMVEFALWIYGGWFEGNLNKEVVIVYCSDLEIWVDEAQ